MSPISFNLQCFDVLTHWGRVKHICVSNLTIIGSDNGLSPGRRQAITWTNVGILLIGPLGTHFSEMLIKINTFSFKKILLKMSSGKWRPFCLGLNVLTFRLMHSNMISVNAIYLFWPTIHMYRSAAHQTPPKRCQSNIDPPSSIHCGPTTPCAT